MCIFVECPDIERYPSDSIENIDSNLFAISYMQKAKKDIKCYKVIRVRKAGNYSFVYHTVIGGIELTKNILEGDEIFAVNDRINITVDRRKHPNIKAKIDRGVIRTFAKEEDAVDYAKKLRLTHKFTCNVYECQIPKGTEYYEGTDEMAHKVYGSKGIKFSHLTTEMAFDEK